MKEVSHLISIITPILNGQRFIKGLLQNISDQTLLPYQHICSDNCSEDLTWEILNIQETKQHIVLNRESHRLSACKSFLAAASLVQSEYTLILPCDDRIHPDNIAIATQILQTNPNIDVIGTDHIISRHWIDWDKIPWSNEITQSYELLDSNSAFSRALNTSFIPWPFTGLIVRTRLLLEFLLGEQATKFNGAYDLALTLWLISKKSNFALRGDFLTFAFLHPLQESSRLTNSWLIDYIKIIRFALSIEGLSDQTRIETCAFFMKLLPVHFLRALKDPSQDARATISMFIEQYSILLSLCSGLDPNFSQRLHSKSMLNEMLRRCLLSMGSKRLIVLAFCLRIL